TFLVPTCRDGCPRRPSGSASLWLPRTWPRRGTGSRRRRRVAGFISGGSIEEPPGRPDEKHPPSRKESRVLAILRAPSTWLPHPEHVDPAVQRLVDQLGDDHAPGPYRQHLTATGSGAPCPVEWLTP